MKAFDASSMSTLEEAPSCRRLEQGGRISFEDLQGSHSLFGVFRLEEYSVMRGFIPGRGKRVRLHYTKFEPAHKVGSICIVHGYGEQSDDYLEVRVGSRRWPTTSPGTGSWCTCWTCAASATRAGTAARTAWPSCSTTSRPC